MSLLEVSNCTKRFGGLIAIKDATLTVEQGEIVSLVGPNGAGKTTLFNVMTGYLRPTRGDICFDGANVTGWPSFRRARAGLIRTFQQNELFYKCTTLDNILMAHHLACGGWDCIQSLMGGLAFAARRGMAEDSALQRSREIMDFVGLTHRADIPARSLPHGEQRLLGLAAALAASPRLLLLDEPVGGMNHNEALKVIKLIQEIRTRGITVLLIEHNMGVVMEISDRVIVLDHGEKICEGVPSEVQANPRVIEAYLGKW